jgi:hypothetical protein
MTGAERHQRAVAHTLGFAREAAAKGDFAGALEWLGVVEIVDGALPAGWELTRAVWLRAQTSGERPLVRPTAREAAAAGRGVGRG